MTDFTIKVVEIISSIPEGFVCTYGQIAAAAGNPKGSRQVSRILHTCSSTHNLPWHRVINSQGKISLPEGAGFEEQASMLAGEGISLNKNRAVDLRRYQFSLPDNIL
jgi:methylated-DNA-protein-cysteine methyltransferase related protein